MRECRLENNIKKCTCTYNSCSRKGKCCECVDYHLKNGEIPGCFFSKDIEKTYDRTIGNFTRSNNTK